jgi:energy-coupling factor transporter ATP-binding protein EcfA2
MALLYQVSMGTTPRDPRKLTEADWNSLYFEASQLFSPSKPINENDLFAGRTAQVRKMLESVLESGKHIVLFGEPGVGKTSLARIFSGLFPSTARHIFQCREQADPLDDFSSLWRKVFKDIHVSVARNGNDIHLEHQIVSLASYYEGEIKPDDVRRELEAIFKPNQIPIVIIDEYNKIADRNCHTLMANTIKALSDYAVNVTVVLVGVADNVNELVGEHPSIQRCLEQVPMPRMTTGERKEILDKIIPRLGMSIDLDALWKIVHLSRGLPSYVHSLGLYATQAAIERKTLRVLESDVDTAIARVLEKSEESIREDYATAIHSNRSDNLYRQVLLACAVADADDRGNFTPLAVCKPLTRILGREKEVEIAAFQQHLKKFITDERKNILVRKGRDRAFRFRFRDPAMQPYVIMRGIEQGFVDKKAIDVLSFPAEPKLPI